MKSSQQGESFLITTNLISLCFMANTHSIFSNLVLLSGYCGQPGVMVIDWIILGIFGTPMTNNYKGGIFILQPMTSGMNIMSCV